MARSSLAGGDRLARGARSVTFKAGDAKKGDKIQINQGTLASEATRRQLDAMTAEDIKTIGPLPSAPVMKRRPRPLYDRVVVRPKSVEEVSKGGIILSTGDDEKKERPREGIVVYVGKGKRDSNGDIRPLDVKPGDDVLFGMYAGTEVEIDGEKVLMFREEEILAVIE